MKSIHTKVIVTCFFVIVFTTVSFSLYSLYAFHSVVKETMGIQFQFMKNEISPQLPLKDILLVLQLTKEDKPPSSIIQLNEYKKVREKMSYLRDSHGLKYLYTIVKNNSGDYVYAIDGFPMNYSNKSLSLPGQIEKVDNDIFDSIYAKKKPSYTGIEDNEKWGELMTTYYPIYNYNGEVVGILGMDVSANQYFDSLTEKIKHLALFSISIIAISLLISYFLSKALVSRVYRLTYYANQIQNGNFNINVDIKGNDEIALLGKTFQNMINTIQSHYTEMNKMIYHDTLTGLPNRRSLEMDFNNMKENTNASFSLFFLDMDNFKTINDSYGHQIGDDFLVEVARRLSLSVENKGSCYRVGGDEFVVLLSLDKKTDILKMAQIISTELGEVYELQIKGEKHSICSNPSIGVTTSDSSDRDLLSLLSQADQAMYQAKKSPITNLYIHNEKQPS